MVTLLLVRGEGRLREVSIRAAMGAGRGRIVRQLVTENLLMAAAGLAAGLGPEVGATEAVEAVASPPPRAHVVR